jgi:hypothetical protein
MSSVNSLIFSLLKAIETPTEQIEILVYHVGQIIKQTNGEP